MPRIVRAEFLKYYNPSRNSDKVFNVFLIEETDGTFSCFSEYGRRGNRLVRDTLCINASREIAEGKLRQKLLAKRNHRETPYTDDLFGQSISGIVEEYGFDRAETIDANSIEASQSSQTEKPVRQKPSVIQFPNVKAEHKRQKPKQNGILNQQQFDSLEI
ncbi:MAG: hypothetical protein ACR2MD_02205 [Aridibacter sp.]